MTRLFRAIDIANFYVQLANDLPETDITNLKLNKLCYYAQCWSLVKLGRPLFSDEIQAWDYGPVIPDVYHTFKVCGRNPIGEPSEHFDETLLDSDELTLLIDVYSSYGKYTPNELITMTHKPGAPWDEVYEEHMNNPIPTPSMVRYFSKSNELHEFTPNITPENTIIYQESAS